MEGLSHLSDHNLQFFQLIGEMQETAVMMLKGILLQVVPR